MMNDPYIEWQDLNEAEFLDKQVEDLVDIDIDFHKERMYNNTNDDYTTIKE